MAKRHLKHFDLSEVDEQPIVIIVDEAKHMPRHTEGCYFPWQKEIYVLKNGREAVLTHEIMHHFLHEIGIMSEHHHAIMNSILDRW